MQPDLVEKMAETVVKTVKAALSAALSPLMARLAAVEARERHDGRDGRPGERGEKGLDGIHGRDGHDAIDGKDGSPGERGEKGDPGESVQGETGPAGEKGEKGDTGAGIASVVISAEGRLVAHLTDGRSVDAGPVPVKEGLPGRDADPSELATLKAEIVTLRAEMAAKKSTDPSEWQASVKQMLAEWPQAPAGDPGRDGASVTVDDVAPLIAAEVLKAVAAIPAPQNGEPGTPGQDGASLTTADVAPLIVAEVERAVAALPLPKDGERGADGKSVSADDVAPLIAAEVTKAIAAIPVPKDGAPGVAGEDGQSITVDDVAPLIAAEVTKAVSAVPVPKDGHDGVGVLGALIGRDGHLVVTLSDGTVKDLGSVVGRDVEMADVARMIAAEVAKIPHPKDGLHGKDGVGFDDLSVRQDGERNFTFEFSRGDQVKSFPFTIPCVIYRDLWTEGKIYEKGDAVTFGGCMWVAKDATTAKPDFTPAASKFWRLAIKEGRRGKDADPAAIEALVNKLLAAKVPKKDPQK